jgi:hypothetical protein
LKLLNLNTCVTLVVLTLRITSLLLVVLVDPAAYTLHGSRTCIEASKILHRSRVRHLPNHLARQSPPSATEGDLHLAYRECQTVEAMQGMMVCAHAQWGSSSILGNRYIRNSRMALTLNKRPPRQVNRMLVLHNLVAVRVLVIHCH